MDLRRVPRPSRGRVVAARGIMRGDDAGQGGLRCGVPSWKLSAEDLDVLVEVMGLPPLPYPLDLPSPGVTFDERRRHVEAVVADLTTRGLVQGGEPVGGLARALDLLARGEVVVDGRVGFTEPLDLVGALDRDRAALATRSGARMRLDLVSDRELVPLIVGLLPPVGRLAGNAMTIPHEAFTRALVTFTETGDLFEVEDALAKAGVRDQDVRLLSGLVRADGVAAQFGVGVRTPGTDVHRERRVWTWHACDLGGALLTPDSAEHPTWISLVPAEPARLGEHLDEALRDRAILARAPRRRG